MPIARLPDRRLLHFAHVPKAGGSSVERHLEARFGRLAFFDGKFRADPLETRWTRSSPQHAARADLARLMPAAFLDVEFAMVRHPVDRLVSVYHWLREAPRPHLPDGMAFGDWLERLEGWLEDEPYIFDRHIRPMWETVPKRAQIFRLEDGMARVLRWIDKVAGDMDGPREIGHEKARDPAAGPKAAPDAEQRRLIGRLYARDYERFGYPPEGSSTSEGPAAHAGPERPTASEEG